MNNKLQDVFIYAILFFLLQITANGEVYESSIESQRARFQNEGIEILCPYEEGNPSQPVLAVLSCPDGVPCHKPWLIMWDNGRIVWSRTKLATAPNLDLEMHGGAPFYEYQLGRNKANNLLNEFKKEGVFDDLYYNSEETMFDPDVSYFVVIIREEDKLVKLGIPAYLLKEDVSYFFRSFKAPDKPDPTAVKRFGVYKSVLSKITALIPTKGKPIDFEYELKKILYKPDSVKSVKSGSSLNIQQNIDKEKR